MNIRAARAGLVIHEIPSHEHRRLHGISKLNVVRDGIRIGKFIMRERFLKQTGRTSQIGVGSVQEGEHAASFLSGDAEQQMATVE
jgi:hypothetical protein